MKTLLDRVILVVCFSLLSLSVCPAIPFWPEKISIELELIIQSEVSQNEKHQYSILTHIYGI